jgi:hypothetical protein
MISIFVKLVRYVCLALLVGWLLAVVYWKYVDKLSPEQ